MQDLTRSYNMIVCPGLMKFSVPRASNQTVRLEKVLHLIMYDLARFVTNPTENRTLINLTSVLVIRFLKDLSVLFDLMM